MSKLAINKLIDGISAIRDLHLHCDWECKVIMITAFIGHSGYELEDHFDFDPLNERVLTRSSINYWITENLK